MSALDPHHELPLDETGPRMDAGGFSSSALNMTATTGTVHVERMVIEVSLLQRQVAHVSVRTGDAADQSLTVDERPNHWPRLLIRKKARARYPINRCGG